MSRSALTQCRSKEGKHQVKKRRTVPLGNVPGVSRAAFPQEATPASAPDIWSLPELIGSHKPSWIVSFFLPSTFPLTSDPSAFGVGLKPSRFWGWIWSPLWFRGGFPVFHLQPGRAPGPVQQWGWVCRVQQWMQ